VTSSPYANLTTDQHRLTDEVLNDPDGRDTRDLLIGTTASAEDKAAVAEALGGPGAGDDFLTGTATPSTPYEAGRLDWSQGRIDQAAALDPDSGEAYRHGLQAERTALVDDELDQLADATQRGGRGWASPEATAAARADLDRRATWHEERGELDYAADLRTQADELDDDADGM
jgi:hypothetical protein